MKMTMMAVVAGVAAVMMVLLLASSVPAEARALNATSNSCVLKATRKNPVEIDLSPLTVKIDYIIKSTLVQTTDFDFNICGDIQFSDSACPPGTMVCERYDTQGQKKGKNVYGLTKHMKLEHAPDNQDGITAILTAKGDKCPSSNADHYHTEMRFKCGKGGYNPPTIKQESELNCFVAIQLSTPYACGTEKHPSGGGGMSAGTVIAILIFVLPLSYMALGAAYMFSRGGRGAELIVHRDFLASLPGLIADGFGFVATRLSGRKVEYARL
ncbi:hypothetical protein PTSG_06189 [Salpingoeca rosetta]|uniref:Autophagy-related protein 27 n=1 Tax=Salpingoeca rosetta (strain ATCC 50818 / BSB-021) TaxID=946362 RepID=F2UC74_SALR5|nr:uncharacterized protein PTSG_06189 [Salpingoeca rosetta]EGD74181.1 hypothetical protein PTSG_06189 [Salpingoeca rosetta]|eukprot:XP_004993081.1 hypothetical protein PTSG_06189 [Salpingoeca rosetta]